MLDFYFALRNFLNIYDLVDDHYVIYSQMTEEGQFRIRLFCVDPSVNLQKCIDKSNSTIFFPQRSCRSDTTSGYFPRTRITMPFMRRVRLPRHRDFSHLAGM